MDELPGVFLVFSLLAGIGRARYWESQVLGEPGIGRARYWESQVLLAVMLWMSG